MQVEKERDGVKQRKWQNRKQRAAGNPLQLLAQQRRVCPAVTAQEEQRGQYVKPGVVGGGNLVQAMQQQAGWQPCFDGPYPQPEQPRPRRVNQRHQPAAADFFEPFLGKTERKMKEERRLQRLRQHIRPEDGPIERVQLGGVLERVKCK